MISLEQIRIPIDNVNLNDKDYDKHNSILEAYPLDLTSGSYGYAYYYFLEHFNHASLVAVPYHIQIYEP